MCVYMLCTLPLHCLTIPVPRQDAVMAIKGGRGIILPINPAALQKVGTTITKGAVTNATDIKSGLLKVGDNVKNVMGDLLSVREFQFENTYTYVHTCTTFKKFNLRS